MHAKSDVISRKPHKIYLGDKGNTGDPGDRGRRGLIGSW